MSTAADYLRLILVITLLWFGTTALVVARNLPSPTTLPTCEEIRP